MPGITIREIDNTASNFVQLSTNAVFIPGLPGKSAGLAIAEYGKNASSSQSDINLKFDDATFLSWYKNIITKDDTKHALETSNNRITFSANIKNIDGWGVAVCPNFNNAYNIEHTADPNGVTLSNTVKISKSTGSNVFDTSAAFSSAASLEELNYTKVFNQAEGDNFDSTHYYRVLDSKPTKAPEEIVKSFAAQLCGSSVDTSKIHPYNNRLEKYYVRIGDKEYFGSEELFTKSGTSFVKADMSRETGANAIFTGLFKQNASAEFDGTKIYSFNGTDTYTHVDIEPGDWADAYTSYYEKVFVNEVTNIIIKDGESFSLKEHSTVDSVFKDVMKFKVSGFNDIGDAIILIASSADKIKISNKAPVANYEYSATKFLTTDAYAQKYTDANSKVILNYCYFTGDLSSTHTILGYNLSQNPVDGLNAILALNYVAGTSGELANVVLDLVSDKKGIVRDKYGIATGISLDNLPTEAISETINIIFEITIGYNTLCPNTMVNTPILCNSLQEFYSNFGTSPYVFTKDQKFTELDKEWMANAVNDNQLVMIPEGTPDPSWCMAKQLLSDGLSVIYCACGDNVTAVSPASTSAKDAARVGKFRLFKSDITNSALVNNELSIKEVYGYLNNTNGESEQYFNNLWEILNDKAVYNKFILSTGGYPIYEYNNNAIVYSALDLAAARGDILVLIDHTNNRYRPTNPINQNSVYKSIHNQSFANGSYGAMYTPWCWYNCAGYTLSLPGSFGFLDAYATSLQTNPAWLSIAGFNRGKVGRIISGNNFEMGFDTFARPEMTQAYADASQTRGDGVSINSIINYKNTQYMIWGNRTLFNNTTSGDVKASSFVNLRLAINEVKSYCYDAAMKYMFEQNSDIMWVNFKSSLMPVFDKLISANIIKNYSIQKVIVPDEDIPMWQAQRGKLWVKITLIPIYPIDDFDFTVIVKDDNVTVTE